MGTTNCNARNLANTTASSQVSATAAAMANVPVPAGRQHPSGVSLDRDIRHFRD